MKLIRRLRYLLNREQAERELQEEMAAHRELAGTYIGPDLRLREEARDAWGFSWLDQLQQDVTYSLRSLRRVPVFTLSAILILTLGLGLNLTLFQLINAELLKPLAVLEPETLAVLTMRASDGNGNRMSSDGISLRGAQALSAQGGVVKAGLWQAVENMAWGDGEGAFVQASFVSGNWFSELGYGAQIGRVFSVSDSASSSTPVAVLSFKLWQSRMGSDPAAINRSVRIDGRVVTVIGVAPKVFPMEGDLWIPHSHLASFGVPSRSVNFFVRTPPGTTRSALRQGTAATAKAALLEGPWTSVSLEPLFATQQFRPDADQRLRYVAAAIVGGLTLLVLLIACANLSNLVLSRALGRLREFSVRAALGASRIRVARQLLAECLLLAVAGGAAGYGFSLVTAGAIVDFADFPIKLDFTPSASLLATGFALAFVAMLGIGLVPVFQICRRDLAGMMKDGNQQATSGLEGSTLRQSLIAAQLTAGCVLLIVAGLMLQNMRGLISEGPGFEPDGLAILNPLLSRVNPPASKIENYWREARATTSALPGVEGVAMTNYPPLAWSSSSTFRAVPGLAISQPNVDPNYFALMRIPILSGRTFEAGDPPNALLISRKVAMTLFGSIEAVGKRFASDQSLAGAPIILGVVEDSRVSRRYNPARGEIYRRIGPESYEDASLLVRMKADPSGVLPAIRRAATAPDNRLFPDVHLVATDVDRYVSPLRASGTIAILVALLALLLACQGVFGVISYAARLRTKEIGIRTALGASRQDVVRSLVNLVRWPAAIAAAAGPVVACQGVKLMSGEPFFLPPLTSSVATLVVILMLIVAAAAALIPAVRALRKDPLQALRYE